jgi:hypothetical protein
MSLRYIARRTRPSSLAFLAITATTLYAQTTKVIDVNEPRPLSRALDLLEIVVGNTINYEDPPYENMADLQDVSTSQQRAANPGYVLLVPRDGHVTAEVQVPLTGAATSNEVTFSVNLLLASYRQNQLPGDFQITQANGMLYVTPTKVLGANGVTLAVTSPMAASVTVPYAQRSVADTAAAIFDEVYKVTGLRIVIGSFPFSPTDMVSFAASGEPARDALARLFAQTAGGPLSYRLNFDPRPDVMRISDYMINVQGTGYVSPMAPAGLGPIIVSPGPSISTQPPAGTRPGLGKPKQ